ncbi:MAG TPA: DUF2911 domain-containing protein, partial [Pyrinomonadaceae bacterium]|nr:DUF2911 domain-containing protein [Pyrinomonadaceae bacterium]
MKRLIPVFILLFAASVTFAQVRPPVPRPSQKMTISQTVGSTDISITYSRPAVKGRTIWGDAPETMASRAKGEATLDDQNARKAGEPIVPWGHVWRAGANEATLFSVADDVLINGQLLPAGKYSFHTIPTKDGNWTLVFNKDDGQWGSFTYDAAKDALRVKTKVDAAQPFNMELLTYYFDPVTDDTATVHLRWEKMDVPFTVKVKDVVTSTINHLKTYLAGAKADDPAPSLNAALYAKSVKRDEATAWFEQSLKINDGLIATKETMQNLARRANILANLGRGPEAIAAGEKAIAAGKATGADTTALEKRVADWKA